MSLSDFYRSRDWENFIARIRLERVNPNGDVICEHCGLPIVRAYDCIGHHKIYLTEENYLDANISLNPENIALVHHRCHNLIHDKLGYKQRQVFIVWGAPLSGKSTYVDSVRCEGDLIVDMDSIWQCISGCQRYVKPARLNAHAFSVRDLLLDQVKVRAGKWNNAYIIGGYPYSGERERLVSKLGAREVFIECSKDECLLRLEADSDRNTSEWTKYINDWFAVYEGGY